MVDNSNYKNEKFWIEDPCILITNFCYFSPFLTGKNITYENRMNSFTRLTIILMIVLYTITKDLIYVYSGNVLIVLIIILYYAFKKSEFVDNFENFQFMENTEPNISNVANNLLEQETLPRRESDFNNTIEDPNNPAKNVQITDYDTKQTYSKATMSDSTMSKFVDGKMFQTSDQYIFDRNTQPFYTTANSSVPNDQTSFANWLYGTENICKEGSIFMHRTGTPEQAQSCNGFNVATPTNFGNLNDYVAPNNQ